MRLRSPKLEKAIRSLAREELRRSPPLLRQFNRRRRRWLVDRIRTIAFWIVALGFLPSLIFVALLQPGADFPGEQNGAELVLVALALVGSAWCFFASTADSAHDPKELSRLALCAAIHFPIRDGELVVRATRHWAIVVFFFTAVTLWLVCRNCIIWNQPVAWGHQAAVGVGLLQGALATAIYLFLANLPDERDLKIALGLLGFLVFVVGVAIVVVANYREDMFDFVTYATFFLLPLGWAHGVLYWGVLQGQPAAYLLLVPPVAVLWLLVNRIRRETSSDDFFFDADKLAEAAAKSEDDPPKRLRESVVDVAEQLRGEIPVVHATRRPRAGSTEAIERRLLEGRWLAGDDRIPWRPVDQIGLLGLTPRERLLIECLHRGRSVLTWQWVVMLVLLVWNGLSFLSEPPGEVSPDAIPLVIAFWWGFVALFSLPALSGYHLLFPVGFHEVSKTILKVGVMKCLCWLPLTVGFSLAVASWHNVPFLSAVSLGLLPMIVYIAWLPASVCIVFGPVIVEAAGWPVRILEVICTLFACVATFLFLMPLGIGRVFFAAVLFAAIGSLWACSAWVYRGSGQKRGHH